MIVSEKVKTNQDLVYTLFVPRGGKPKKCIIWDMFLRRLGRVFKFPKCVPDISTYSNMYYKLKKYIIKIITAHLSFNFWLFCRRFPNTGKEGSWKFFVDCWFPWTFRLVNNSFPRIWHTLVCIQIDHQEEKEKKLNHVA